VIGGESEETASAKAYEVRWGLDSTDQVQRTRKE